MRETQESISIWAEETFGPTGSNLRTAIRANEEMAELLRELAIDDKSPKAGEEIADIIIVLLRLATKLNTDAGGEIDRKMSINRKRRWECDGTGHGRHLRQQ